VWVVCLDGGGAACSRAPLSEGGRCSIPAYRLEEGSTKESLAALLAD